MNKLYECQIDGCSTLSNIRSKIKNKDSEYYGLYVCNKHANQEREHKVTSGQTRRTQEKRKEQRKDYPEFYQRWCEKVQKMRCAECSKPLQGNSTEICHVLSKSTSPEFATNDLNIIVLCSSHHTQFDRNLETRSQMECFQESVERFKLLEPNQKNVTAETLFYSKYLHTSK